MTRPPSSLTRAQSTTDAVRTLILGGEFEPGARLRAQTLADRLGVSRTPVVDALAALQAEGLLEYEARRGYGLKRFDLQMLLDAYDVRLTLEGLSCRIVADRGLDETTTEALGRNLAESERLVFGASWTSEDRSAWWRLNEQFHDLILEAANNPYLTAGVMNTRLVRAIYDRAFKDIAPEDVLRRFHQSESQQSVRDHLRIVEALKARQSRRADNMMQEHILANREVGRRKLQELIDDAKTE